MTRIIRVFPRKTKATPDDSLAYFGPPDLFAEADEVHVSVTFTYNKAIAERLAEQWRCVAPVKIGGVAYGDSSLEFIPGRYVKPGYTITSRARRWIRPTIIHATHPSGEGEAHAVGDDQPSHVAAGVAV